MEKAKRNEDLISSKDYETLVKENINLIHIVIKKEFPSIKFGTLCYEDAFSDGLFALYKAATKFNLDAGFSFSTFASRCISNQIKLSYRKITKSVKYVSIYDSIDIFSDGKSAPHKEICIIDRIKDEKDCFKIIKSNYFNKAFNEALNTIAERDREIFMLNYVNGMSQIEISKKFNMSQSYISRILRRTKVKLQRELLKRDIDKFFFNE